MSLFNRYPIARWLVPAAAVALLLSGTTLIRAAVASPGVSPASLPTQSATDLMADVAGSSVENLSGTIVQTSNLGIPDLPGLSLGDGSSLTSLLSGTHTLRVWARGSEQQRLSVLSQLGETDIVHNGGDLWIWSSSDNTASHRTVGQHAAAANSLPSAADLTPATAARMLVTMLGSSTTVTTAGNDVIAGRPAYELLLQPKDTRSLISSIRIGIDGSQHVPLRVQVMATGQTQPAVEIAFTAVDFSQPDASEFTFNPPPGASIDDRTGDSSAPECTASPRPSANGSDGSGLKVVGSGWTTVVVAALPPAAARSSKAPAPTSCAGTGLTHDLGVGSLSKAIGSLPAVSGSWGSGHVLAGTVLSVLVTDDGRVAVGPVAPDLLYAALTSK